MNALYEKLSDGRLVCRTERPLPAEVSTIANMLGTGKWMIELYPNSTNAQDAKFCKTRLGNLSEDMIVVGSNGGIFIAIPDPKC